MGNDGGPVAVRTCRVYQKDLYEKKFSYTVRLDSSDVEHGDLLRVTVERMERSNTDTDDSSGTGEET